MRGVPSLHGAACRDGIFRSEPVNGADTLREKMESARDAADFVVNVRRAIERDDHVIGAGGKIEKIFAKVKPEGHAEQVLAVL